MRLLFLTLGDRVPSSRYRVLQYLPLLESKGLTCHVRTLHPDVYTPWIGSSSWAKELTRRSKVVTLWQLAQRLVAFPLVRRADVVVIQRPLLGVGSAFLEEWVSRVNPNVVFDFDDAIYFHEDPDVAAVLEGKVERILRVCAAATCGNSHLRDYASRFTEAHLIPTSADVHRIQPRNQRDESSASRVTIGWVGQSSNFGDLRRVENVIADVVGVHRHVDFVVVSDLPYTPANGGLEVRWVRWTAENQVDDLHRLHIGLMPLSDSPWSEVKCGGKLVDYCAAGLATVSSDSVAARDIIRHGETGFVAHGLDHWRAILGELVEDSALRSRIGAAARMRAERHFSIQANHLRLLGIYRSVAESNLRR